MWIRSLLTSSLWLFGMASVMLLTMSNIVLADDMLVLCGGGDELRILCYSPIDAEYAFGKGFFYFLPYIISAIIIVVSIVA